MELIAEWKRLKQRFARNAAVAYKAISKTLREKFGGVGITASFCQLEEIATSQTQDVDKFGDTKRGHKLMSQLAAECKEAGAKWAVMEWLMQKTVFKLLKLHTHGMREIQGLNRKIAKELKQATRLSCGELLPERAQGVKSQLVELSKVMEHQAAILACLDWKVEDIRKLNTRIKLAVSKVTNASFKVFKSYSSKSCGSCKVLDGHIDIKGNEGTGAENFHEHGDSYVEEDLSQRAGGSPSTGDSSDIGDSTKCGGSPKVRVIHVKPLYSDDSYDNGELGIKRTNSSENNSSSWQNDVSTLVLLASSPVHSPTESQTSSIQMDGICPKTASPLSISPLSSDHYSPKCQLQAATPSYNGDKPLKTAWVGQELMPDFDSPQTVQPLCEQSDVYVRVVKAYQAQCKNELNLKVGQILKQKTPAYSGGFAYGWTKAHRLAFKRRGFYPVDCVELISNGKKND